MKRVIIPHQGVEMKKSERLTKVQYLRTFSDDVTESKLSLSEYPADWEPCLEVNPRF